MNNKEFIAELAERTGFNAKDTQKLVNNLIDAMGDAFQEDNSIMVANFGVFETKKKMERIMVNPSTGQRMLVPPKMVLTFKPVASIKQKLKTEKHFGDIYPRKDMEYSYNDGDLYYFMDPESYELIPVNSKELSDNFKFVKENETCKVMSYNGNVFAVEPPMFVELAITETEPGFKGDTATGATKPATVETGANVSVPLFVNEGDVIKIDTRTGEYLSRV